MPAPKLTSYPENSPAALLRVVALFMVSDGHLDDGEVDALVDVGLLETVGADRHLWAEVFDTYCEDLLAHAGEARRVSVADAEWVDAVLAPVTDPARRRYLAGAIFLVSFSDGHLDEAEMAVYRRLLERWDLNFEELAAGA